MTTEPTRCLSVAEVADLLACSPSYVRMLCRDGALTAVRLGRRWAIPIASYEAYVTAHLTATDAG